MCLSKPHRVLQQDGDKVLVEFSGKRRVVKSPVPLKRGDFVLCQNSFVVKKIPPGAAREMLREWSELNEWE